MRKRVANYAALHGWSVSRLGDARLDALLEELAPEEKWGPNDVMQVERPPESVYLFGYNVSFKKGRSNPSAGNACLANTPAACIRARWRSGPGHQASTS